MNIQGLSTPARCFLATRQLNVDGPGCRNVTIYLISFARRWFCLLSDTRSVTTMGGFRSRSRLGSYLALFALAFQLAVSFAHVHLDHVASVSTTAATVASAQLSADDASAPSTPTGHENLADDFCPICTLTHLAGAIMPTQTPPLPLPSIFALSRLEAAIELSLAASHRVLFQARAPPIA
jgi:hypothetical protein